MPIGLRPGVSFCEASGHLVFLDVAADRYFGLSGAAEAAFRRCLESRGCTGAAGEALLRSGLLVNAADAAPLRPCPPPPDPQASLLERALPQPRPCEVATAIAGTLRRRAQLRVAGLEPALRSVAAAKRVPRAAPGSASLIDRAAASYRASALFVRSHDQCLARSIALAHHVIRRGAAVSLVIGVHARPFSAHAWVQCGALLLNETGDGVRAYTPILVL